MNSNQILIENRQAAPMIHRPVLQNYRIPYEGEAAHRFFEALADLNGYYSPATMALRFDLNARRCDPQECLQFVSRLPISDEGKRRLVAATPSFGADQQVTLLGQTFWRDQWSATPRRFCPACWTEAHYQRSWWDLRQFRCCPIHGRDLVSTDTGDRVVPDDAYLRIVSPFGHRTTVDDVRHIPAPTSSLERYTLERMGILDPHDSPFLDEIPILGDIYDVIYVFQDAAAERKLPRSAVDCFRTLAGGADAISTFLDQIATSSETRAWGLFGQKLKTTLENRSGGVWEIVRDAANRIAGHRGIFWKGNRDVWRSETVFTINRDNLAHEVGLDPRLVRRIAEEQGLRTRARGQGSNPYETFNAADADQIRTFAASLMNRDEAAKYFGVSPALFTLIVKEAIILPYAKIVKNSVYADHFIRNDMDAVSEIGLGLPWIDPESIPDGLMRIGDICPTSRWNPAPQLQALVAGVGCAVARTGERFGDVVLDMAVLYPERYGAVRAKRSRQRTTGEGMPIFVARAFVGENEVTTRRLIDVGLIEVMEAEGGKPRVSLSAIEEFTAKWASARLFADHVNETLATFVDRLAARSILNKAVVITPNRPPMTIVDRESAKKALNLDCSPDEPGGDPIIAIIKRVTREVATLINLAPTNGLAASARNRIINFQDARREVSIDVVLDTEAQSIRVVRRLEVTPIGSPSQIAASEAVEARDEIERRFDAPLSWTIADDAVTVESEWSPVALEPAYSAEIAERVVSTLAYFRANFSVRLKRYDV
ncbi:hypothetical protein EYW49_21225 [Siculibacillus lacustris]|uniref:TniQ domain-containing protein n=1 Tax=Siculibacillus lacustris TaxID=1549641 RepID=A0A4Q9VE44_9HYPH|nr:TniQ family protein [Siculibacillus lacustris]TBW32917.1 hypothetical protein EYW49_21225 [Siculibacillus lacustris]